MRILIVAFALISTAICFVISKPTMADTSDEQAQPQTITIRCPESLQAEIVNVPKGWTAGKGPGAEQKFKSVLVSKEDGKPSIGCVYGGDKAGFAAFSLSRTMPANFVCKVDGKDQVTCNRR